MELASTGKNSNNNESRTLLIMPPACVSRKARHPCLALRRIHGWLRFRESELGRLVGGMWKMYRAEEDKFMRDIAYKN